MDIWIDPTKLEVLTCTLYAAAVTAAKATLRTAWVATTSYGVAYMFGIHLDTQTVVMVLSGVWGSSLDFRRNNQ